MVEHIDVKMKLWGEWVRQVSMSSSGGLVMRYEKPGVMSTNPNADNPVAEQIDRLISGLPPYLIMAKRALKRKYIFEWRNQDGARDMGISRSRYEQLIDKSQIWIDAKWVEEKSLTFAYA